MMCSSWKISIFGILALMLAFGMTTDALAAKGNVTMSHDKGSTGVRAASEVIITFTINVFGAPDGDEDKEGTVHIAIPSVWSRPQNANNIGDPNDIGEVVFATDATGLSGDVVIDYTSRLIEVTAGKDATGSITAKFMTVVPPTSGVYDFPVSGGSYHTARASSSSDAAEISKISISVGPVAAGTGKVALAGATAEPMVDDKVLAYEGKYLLLSEQALSLKITFTAPGTMAKDSEIAFSVPDNSFPAFQRLNDSGEVAVTGHVEVTRAARKIIAKVKDGGLSKGNTVTFSIPSHYKAPKVEANAILSGYTINVTTMSKAPAAAIGGVTFGDDAEKSVGGENDASAQFDFWTTKKAPVGKASITQASGGGTTFTHIVAEGVITDGELNVTFTEMAGIAPGAKYEVSIPAAFTAPFVPININSTTNGATTPQTVTINGRTFSGDFTVGSDGTVTAPSIKYMHDKAPKDQGAHKFVAKASVGGSKAPHSTLAEIGVHTVEVVVGAGKGSLVLTRNGQPFNQATSGADIGDLTFTFTPGGYMASDSKVAITRPTGTDDAAWTAFRAAVDGDGVVDVGEVTLSGDATLGVAPDTITATTTKALTASDKIAFTWRKVKAPKTKGSYEFTATSSSYSAETAAPIGSVSVGIGRSPDGGGTLALSNTEAEAGAEIGDLTISYAAAGEMDPGSVIQIALPASGDWPQPTYDISKAGGVTLSDRSSTLTLTDTTMSATTAVTLNKDQKIHFIYKNITAPAAGGTYTFTGKSKSSAGGNLTSLTSGGVTITVNEVAAGTVSLTNAQGNVSSSDPGMALGDLTFTFTAGSRMEVGSKVVVTIPLEWTPAFLDNNDGVAQPGEASLTGDADFAVSGGGGTPWKLTATTNQVLVSGNALVFSYKSVTAPAAEDTYTFMTTASTSAAGKELPVQAQPTVVVRAPVTAIAIAADPTSVFTDGEIGITVTLWAGAAEGKALGAVDVTLDDGEAGGTFTPASITIADNMHSGTATYTNTTAGAVTITATSGDMTDTADVEVKSTIRDLTVDNALNALVKQGATIMVSATGKAGGGTVTVMDADGEKVGTTKALDPVGDVDPDGDQEYSRSITLPATLADGTYTISVAIQGDTNNSLSVKVVNDQTPPAVSDAKALPDTVKNGELFTLSANVALPKNSSLTIKSVMADVSELDSTQTDAVEMTEQKSAAGTYTAIITVDEANTAMDGAKEITITAMDDLGNSGTEKATVTLRNDAEAPMLSMPKVDPPMAGNGKDVTISVNGGESGLTVTADASAIGGDAAEALTETKDADGVGTGIYESEAITVTGAEHGAQTVTITAKDASNTSTMDATVTIDAMGPTLTMASEVAAKAGMEIAISVNGGESGLTVTANATTIGGAAEVTLTEGKDADMAGTMEYSGTVTVGADLKDGDYAVAISAEDKYGNSETASASVSVDNTAPTLTVTHPPAAVNGDTVTISATTETGATVTANASAIGGAAAVTLDESTETAGSYSTSVEISVDAGGDMKVPITASDALDNMSEAVSATVSVHEVTSVTVSPMEASTRETVTVTAMGTAGQTATFSVGSIVMTKTMTESETAAGTYTGSFDTVADAHADGVYDVTVNIGVASMMSEGALTIDHMSEFTLTIPAGVHLIHIPLKIDGMDTVSDLHAALGDAVNYIITLGADGNWNSYLGASSAGTAADAKIGADTGLVAVMNSEATLNLEGSAHGADGASSITLVAGTNLVGVPLKPPAVGFQMISDVVTLPAITSVVVSNAAGEGFNAITQAGDPGDGPITGGTGYIVLASAAATIPVVGEAWEDAAPAASAADMTANGAAANGAAASAPSIGVQTPALHVQGKLIDDAGMLTRDGLTVSVRNVTSGTTLGSETVTDEYSMTFVKLDTHAAKVGDVIEIKADSSNPLLGIRPVQYVVTSEDVLTSRISLPDLVTYEIPAQTELLANYPNPFNPETWIPFRLAKDASVTLTIYGTYGDVVRNIDIGFTPAAVYEGRSDAIYWDGKNDFGEQVASGIYFYHLHAGDFSATRKMVIVK